LSSRERWSLRKLGKARAEPHPNQLGKVRFTFLACGDGDERFSDFHVDVSLDDIVAALTELAKQSTPKPETRQNDIRPGIQ
jgi:hypothetical protein